MFFDATTRRQTPFTTLVIGLMDESSHLDTVVVSSCIVLEDETSETTVDTLFEEVSFAAPIPYFISFGTNLLLSCIP